MKSVENYIFSGIFAIFLLGASGSLAEETTRKPYSPPVAADYPQRVLWGDTHLHSNRSVDAYSMGNETVSAADAFRFARGETVVSPSGQPARLRRSLDFLAVTDHGEYLGVYINTVLGNKMLLKSDVGKRWRQMVADGDVMAPTLDFVESLTGRDPHTPLPDRLKIPEKFSRVIWREVVADADRFNQPGRFTALVGYEWTSHIRGNNLHRVVLFKEGGEKVASIIPYSAQNSSNPEDLWAALADWADNAGVEAIAIPHNGNVSNGMMFAPTTLSGEPISAQYAKIRARWEPVYEMTQVKGDAEAHPKLSPDDEFADFENWDQFNILMDEPKEDWMLQYEYARSALKLGLAHEEKLGVNPFKFGVIGSTDSHTGLSTAEEGNFFGKFENSEPSASRMFGKMAGMNPNWSLVSSGLAAVWAKENTRDAIFDAFRRREVYATTGTRITVRMFGGWDFEASDVHRADYAGIGYAKGVPMGADLSHAPKGKAPVFMVTAAKDPDGANLDRIQIIKGWLDAEGQLREKIYDVALSDGREVDPATGKAPSVGNTVNIQTATYSNSIGDEALSAVWTDPDFDPALRAFYYARVIEIPTPRWTAYDAAYFGIEPPEGAPMTVTDRAYTSAIWYKPVTP